jgi:UDP-N-acetylglucosamine acyltransferase
VSEDAQKHLKTAYRILYRQGLATKEALQKIRAELEMGPELEHLVGFIESSERGIVK